MDSDSQSSIVFLNSDISWTNRGPSLSFSYVMRRKSSFFEDFYLMDSFNGPHYLQHTAFQNVAAKSHTILTIHHSHFGSSVSWHPVWRVCTLFSFCPAIERSSHNLTDSVLFFLHNISNNIF